jgi:predicted glutamine amidotransferase
MCRHVAVISHQAVPAAGLLLDEPNSLRKQCVLDCHGERHPDGWGLGCYVADRPEAVVVKQTGDAAADPAFESAARKLTATTWIAHVRQASVGAANVANCHPFSYGCWMLAHNGTVTNFAEIEPWLEATVADPWLAQRQGTTDSELLFCRILADLSRRGAAVDATAASASTLREIIERLLHDLADWASRFPPDPETKFNFLLTNGRALAASRWNHDLHWKQTAEGVVVASEAIGSGPWQEVPEHSILTVDESFSVQMASAPMNRPRDSNPWA